MPGIKSLLSSKKAIFITSIVILMIISILTVLFIITRNTSTQISPNTSSLQPEYQTVLPAGKTIEQLGGWSKISPPKSDPVYAYSDKIGTIGISVSEQLLPETFKNNLDTQVAELAKKFNATTQIEAAGTKAYIGTSAKGPQSAIITQDGLLILIKSQEKISVADWKTYIQSLTPASKY